MSLWKKFRHQIEARTKDPESNNVQLVTTNGSSTEEKGKNEFWINHIIVYFILVNQSEDMDVQVSINHVVFQIDGTFIYYTANKISRITCGI
jgi:hypothetical protein